jgi:hypothetical protein
MISNDSFKIMQEVEKWLWDHVEGTSMSGHFDIVPQKLAEDFSKAVKEARVVPDEPRETPWREWSDREEEET